MVRKKKERERKEERYASHSSHPTFNVDRMWPFDSGSCLSNTKIAVNSMYHRLRIARRSESDVGLNIRISIHDSWDSLST